MHGAWHSHVGWVLEDHERDEDVSRVPDLVQCWELRWLDRLHWLPGILLIPLCYWIVGWSGIAWGFVVSTVVLYHGTFMVNSVCHIFGYRNYDTQDGSRNNWIVALIFTLGEGGTTTITIDRDARSKVCGGGSWT